MTVERKLQAVEADRVEDQPHPREIYELIGQDAALRAAAHAVRRGRPPSAWLIAGPPGVGKATLAYRIARYLFRYGATAEGPADLFVAPNDPVSRLVEAEAHPGLLVLKRRADERGRLRAVLSVDEIRKLESFFGLTATGGGWRVAIIDCADDLGDAAANALLKMLEEPPRHAMVLVLSHAPGRLLPTIRSRCQRLMLRPLPAEIMDDALAKRLAGADAHARHALLVLSEGSLGLALRLAGTEGMALAAEAESILSASGAPDINAALILGERVARMPDGLGHFGRFLATALAQRIRTDAKEGQMAGLDHAVAVWERVNSNFARAKGLYLEPRQTVLAAVLAVGRLRGP